MREDIKEQIKIYQANDYEIKEETPMYIIMEKRTSSIIGHILVFLLFGCITCGLANLIYYYIAKKEKKIIK